MYKQAASPSGPLYQLKQGTLSITGRTTEITGNHILDQNTAGTTGARYLYVDGTTFSASVLSTTWFTLHAGDSVTFKWLNFSYTNYYTSGSSNCYLEIRDVGGTALVRLSNVIPANSTGTMSDTESTFSIESDTNIACLYFYLQRKSTTESNVEVWVNGVQYI